MRAMRTLGGAVLAVAALAACSPDGATTLGQGDCVQVSDLTEEFAAPPTVDCEEPHEAEVYSVFDLALEGAYQEALIVAEVEERCVQDFSEFINVAYAESELDIFYLYPLADGWEEGDREAVCAVIAPDWESEELQMVTGTLAGSGR